MYRKTKGGGQFFKDLGNNTYKMVCTYDFNPIIERRRIRALTFAELALEECSEEEFSHAEEKAMEMLELPVNA